MSRRRAVTLLELLVVIAIILLLAGLSYLLVPAMFSNHRRVSAVDQVSQWLLTARQRARRDGLPTGLRLLPTTDDAGNTVVNADGSVTVRRLQYVQQPAPLVGGTTTTRGQAGGVCASVRNGVATFRNVDFIAGGGSTDEYLVQPGDYLELRGGGVHRIVAVTATRLTLADATFNPPLFVATANYRILRRSRPLLGERVLEVPADTVIDLGAPTALEPRTKEPLSFRTQTPTRSVNVPERLAGGGPTPATLILEIVFSPGGAVLGESTGKVILWLRDAEGGSPSLIAIPVGTGFVGAYEVAPGGNPYAHAESGRGAGL